MAERDKSNEHSSVAFQVVKYSGVGAVASMAADIACELFFSAIGAGARKIPSSSTAARVQADAVKSLVFGGIAGGAVGYIEAKRRQNAENTTDVEWERSARHLPHRLRFRTRRRKPVGRRPPHTCFRPGAGWWEDRR